MDYHLNYDTVPPLLMFGRDLSGIPLTKILSQFVYHLLSIKQWPHNTLLHSDWLMLYIE